VTRQPAGPGGCAGDEGSATAFFLRTLRWLSNTKPFVASARVSPVVLLPSEMKRLKQLDEENRRLKKLVADVSLDKEMLQDVIRRKI